MSITAGDLRRMIDGLPDDTEVLPIFPMHDRNDTATVAFLDAFVDSNGDPRIEVEIMIADDEDDEDDDLDDDSSWRCDRCGCPLNGDEVSVGLCDTCELDDEE